MARYLIVAHQTATSPALVSRVRAMLAVEPGAEFVVLVPATPVEQLPWYAEGDARSLARRVTRLAKAALEAVGARVVRTEVGAASPLVAIDDELRAHPGEYAGIVISTFAPGSSRWLQLDLPASARARFGLEVTHVTSPPSANVTPIAMVAGEWEGESTIPVVVGHLIGALEDPDGGIRWLAAEGLVAAGPRGLELLLQALIREPQSGWLREGARHVLHAIRRRRGQAVAHTEALERALEQPLPAIGIMVAASESLARLREARPA